MSEVPLKSSPPIVIVIEEPRRIARRGRMHAHRLVYHSTLGWRVIKKKKK